MDRIAAAQSILDASRDGNYLEIGVNTGASFIPIQARRKWGVDPSYHLTQRRRMKYAVFSFLGIKVEQLFRMTSDAFFSAHEKILATYGIDVCLVDGLHTYEQALKDVLNALPYLKTNGVILMHDCNPATELMALPAASIEELMKQGIPGWNGAWSGDVWKAVVHLRSLQEDVDAFVLDCDTGLGVVTRRRPASKLPYTAKEIEEMSYGFFDQHRKELLNLQPPDYFTEFLRGHANR